MTTAFLVMDILVLLIGKYFFLSVRLRVALKFQSSADKKFVKTNQLSVELDLKLKVETERRNTKVRQTEITEIKIIKQIKIRIQNLKVQPLLEALKFSLNLKFGVKISEKRYNLIQSTSGMSQLSGKNFCQI